MGNNKRGNETSQLSKEDYDQLEGNDNDNGGVVFGTFQRADAATISNRRMIRTSASSSRTSASSSNPTTATTTTTRTSFSFGSSSVAAASNPTATKAASPLPAKANPFSSINLVPTSSGTNNATVPSFSFGRTTKTGTATTSISNPSTTTAVATNPFSFGSTSGGTSSSSTTTTATAEQPFSFGTSLSSTSPKTAASTITATSKPFTFGTSTTTAATNANPFQFGSSSSTTSSTTTPTTDNKTTKSTVKDNRYMNKAIDLDETLYRTVTDHRAKIRRENVSLNKATNNKVANYSEVFERYLLYGRKIQCSWFDEKNRTIATTRKEGGNGTPSTSAASVPSTTTKTTTAIETTKVPTFSFGVGTRTAAPSNTSITGTGFSFPSSAAAPAPTPATVTPAAATAVGTDNDDAFPPEETVAVGKAEDIDWNSIGSYDRVRFYRLTDPKNVAESSWVSFAFGQLYLQQSRANDKKYRIMMRDDVIGKVLINMSINPTITFKFTENTKKNVGQISFMGCNNVDRGIEGFIIKATLPTCSELHTKLQSLF